MDWLFSPAVLVGVVVGGIAAYALRAQFMGGDYARWRGIAWTLPWRDRWRLHVATTRGRAVTPERLAPLAVQRAELIEASTVAVLAAPWHRWLYVGSIVLWGGLAAINVASDDLMFAIISVAVGVVSLFAPLFERHGLARTRRSLEANRALVASLAAAE
jgi:hypothetical protein